MSLQLITKIEAAIYNYLKDKKNLTEDGIQNELTQKNNFQAQQNKGFFYSFFNPSREGIDRAIKILNQISEWKNNAEEITQNHVFNYINQEKGSSNILYGILLETFAESLNLDLKKIWNSYMEMAPSGTDIMTMHVYPYKQYLADKIHERLVSDIQLVSLAR